MIQYKTRAVTVFESALFRTTSTVIATDDMVLVVDPNWLPAEVMAISALSDSLLFENDKRVLYLLFTHSDYDHIIGWKAFPDARVIASEAFVNNPEKAAVIEQILKWDDEYYVSRPYPIEYPAVDVVVKQDGQSLQIGHTKLTFYLAPGHNPDGIFTLLESPEVDGIFLAGDYLCNVEFPYIYYSSAAYEETLAKVDGILEKHKVRLLVPGHGDVALPAAEILTRKTEALSYIHELRQCIRESRDFDTDRLWQRYRFRRGMESFHQENLELLKKELSAFG